jgi:beta-lactamase class D
VSALLLGLWIAAASAQTPDYGPALKGYDSCFLVIEAESGKEVLRHGKPKWCRERLPVASAFQLPLAVMAFDSGVLADENDGFKWDGTVYPIEEWNRDQTAKTWMRDSVDWFSRHLTPLIGEPKAVRYLKTFEFGAADLPGETLKISPEEQARFAARLFAGKLPVSARALEAVKRVSYLETSGRGSRLSGKTGSGVYGFSQKRRLGWFVGYLERDQSGYAVVLAIVDKHAPAKSAPLYLGRQARQLAQDFLLQAGYW